MRNRCFTLKSPSEQGARKRAAQPLRSGGGFSVRRWCEIEPASISAERLEEALDIGRVEGRGGVTAGFIDPGGERLLALLQFQHALFDGTLRDELVDKDRLVLADAVGAVGRLVLDRRVPPGVVMDDRVGGGQIETSPAGLEADQKERHLAPLEARDRAGTVLRVAAQLDKLDAGLAERRLDQVEHAGELREQQDAPAVLDELRQHLYQMLELGAGGYPPCCGEFHQTRVAAHLAEL